MLTKDEKKLMQEFNVKTRKQLERELDRLEIRTKEEEEYYHSFIY